MILSKIPFEGSKVENFKSGDLLACTIFNLYGRGLVLNIFRGLQFDGLITKSHCVKIFVVKEQLIIGGLRRLSAELLSQ